MEERRPAGNHPRQKCTVGERDQELEAITRGSNAAPVKKVIMSADGDFPQGLIGSWLAFRVAVSEVNEATEYGWIHPGTHLRSDAIMLPPASSHLDSSE
ncbi:hypothetical protein N7510_011134 [Penicillium lagena]|uniref:uncharacterized protein n=1 Tax=Penicillium lagena TaxID=94218 RepID=UPI0025416F49|nr:uncharacterized protein N7510_011134 [Penicillium lagena]KAJ5601600.1 hypothetical protein N7510_011134 [Penicillium lagena]